MNPENNEQWRTSGSAQSQAPYQSIESQSVDETERTEEERAFAPDASDDTPSSEPSSEMVAETQDPIIPTVRWEAPEYVTHSRSTGWYIIFSITVLVLMALAWFLLSSITFAVLLPVMALAFILYTKAKPSTMSYAATNQGVYVNDRLYPFQEFKAFSVLQATNDNILQLIPRKRFKLGQIIHFPSEVGESLVDLLAAHLPMQDGKRDIYDKITTKLKM